MLFPPKAPTAAVFAPFHNANKSLFICNIAETCFWVSPRASRNSFNRTFTKEFRKQYIDGNDKVINLNVENAIKEFFK